jgi:hypothetical protein
MYLDVGYVHSAKAHHADIYISIISLVRFRNIIVTVNSLNCLSKLLKYIYIYYIMERLSSAFSRIFAKKDTRGTSPSITNQNRIDAKAESNINNSDSIELNNGSRAIVNRKINLKLPYPHKDKITEPDSNDTDSNIKNLIYTFENYVNTQAQPSNDIDRLFKFNFNYEGRNIVTIKDNITEKKFPLPLDYVKKNFYVPSVTGNEQIDPRTDKEYYGGKLIKHKSKKNKRKRKTKTIGKNRK